MYRLHQDLFTPLNDLFLYDEENRVLEGGGIVRANGYFQFQNNYIYSVFWISSLSGLYLRVALLLGLTRRRARIKTSHPLLRPAPVV